MTPTRSLTRRRVLKSSLPLAGSLAIAAFVPGFAGCGAPPEAELERRFTASLRSALAGATQGAVVGPGAMERATAFATLRGSLSPVRLRALTWNDALLRRYLADRRSRDLSEGRTRFVGGWLMAETEIAIAVLLGP